MVNVNKVHIGIYILGIPVIIVIIAGTTLYLSSNLTSDTSAVLITNTKGETNLYTRDIEVNKEISKKLSLSARKENKSLRKGANSNGQQPLATKAEVFQEGSSSTVMDTSSRRIASLKDGTSLTEWETYKCKPLEGSLQQGRFILTGLKNGKWDSDGFCVAFQALNYTNFGNTYTYSVNLWNQAGIHQIPNHGHPGISFNILDEYNYDLVFIRLHDRQECYQTGYVKKGLFGNEVKSNCCPRGPPKGRTWFTLKIIVKHDHVNVLLNGDSLIQYKPHFPSKGNVGVLLANGFQNQIYFKDAVISINV